MRTVHPSLEASLVEGRQVEGQVLGQGEEGWWSVRARLRSDSFLARPG